MREGLAELDSTMGQISKKVDELVQLERQARNLVNELKQHLMKDVQEVRLPGVTIHETASGGTFAIVKFSDFNVNSWSPQTYIPKEQAKAVIGELESATTVESICKRVGKMLEKGYVGDRPDDRTYLNDYTLNAIQNSDIGVYVMAHGYAPNAKYKELESAKGR